MNSFSQSSFVSFFNDIQIMISASSKDSLSANFIICEIYELFMKRFNVNYLSSINSKST